MAPPTRPPPTRAPARSPAWPPARPPPPAQAPVRPPPPRGRGSQRPMLTAAMRIGERMRGFAYPLSSSPKMRHRMRTLLEQLQWLQVAQFPHAQRATRPAGNSLIGKRIRIRACKLQQIWLQDWPPISMLQAPPPPPPPATTPLWTLPSSSSFVVARPRRPAYHLAYVKVSLFATPAHIAPLQADPI